MNSDDNPAQDDPARDNPVTEERAGRAERPAPARPVVRDGAGGRASGNGGAGASTMRGVGVALAVLFSLVAIGAASYAIWVLQVQDRTDPRIGESAAQIETLMTRVATQDATIRALRADLDRVSSRPDPTVGLRDEVLSRIDDLQAQLGGSKEIWVLAEVEYLIRMGNQRVLMDRDPGAAIALFTQAGEILGQAEGLTAHRLRQALANDIAKLQAVERLDREGIFVRLSALIAAVADLHEPERRFTPVTAAGGDDSQTPAGWFDRTLAFLKRALGRLGSLVDFRRDVPPITPILPPEESYYVRQNLVMKLQLAQLALMRHERAVYNDSLADAMAWVERYFDVDRTGTVAFMDSLRSLEGIDVAEQLPDVSASLREIRLLSGTATAARAERESVQ